jgi:hypothetical protein
VLHGKFKKKEISHLSCTLALCSYAEDKILYQRQDIIVTKVQFQIDVNSMCMQTTSITITESAFSGEGGGGGGSN